MNETSVASADRTPSSDAGRRQLGTPGGIRLAQAARSTVRVLYVRLRFLLLIAAVGLVLGRWDDWRDWTDRGLDRLFGVAAAPKTISPDTEFFCPMCPGVVTRWPEKCPVCKMPLVRRKKGTAGILPNGVVARMQVTPYRVQLAGVRTVPVTYRSLAAEITATGRFTAAEDGTRGGKVQVSSLDAAMVRKGQAAELKIAGGDPARFWRATVVRCELEPTDSAEAAGRGAGRDGNPQRPVASSRTVHLQAADEPPWPEPHTPCVAAIHALLAEREPFVSIPHGAPALSSSDLRTVHSCPEHSEYLFVTAGKCPFDELELVPRTLLDGERVEWWCPAHPEVTGRGAGQSCSKCSGQLLVPRIVTYWPAGKVLAVPDTAVIEAGYGPIVFVETSPGMFDGRAVEVGPAADGFVSVVRGLAVGEQVVVTGAFLLEAETRLNPAVAAAYFGATAAVDGAAAVPAAAVALADTAADRLDPFSLSARDRVMALQQRVCPVTRLPLGSMGAPIPVVLPECTFYLCCEGCRGRLPQRTRVAAEPRRTP